MYLHEQYIIRRASSTGLQLFGELRVHQNWLTKLYRNDSYPTAVSIENGGTTEMHAYHLGILLA